MRRVTTIFILCGALLLCRGATAQTNNAPADDATQSIQDWMNENLDDNVLQFLSSAERTFAGTNVYDMAALKAVAAQALPVLDEFEETEPYANWLRAHLDDLDVASQMRRQMTASSTNAGGKMVLTSPSLKLQRSLWIHELQKQPLPPLAKTYLPKLKQIFIAEKVPPQLAWVAGVESSFEPRARSPAGAAGMFQLMPATARMEHLSLWPFDQRYQPEKSAHAAADQLRKLHRHFGDWELALAAYNVGENRMDKLLKQHRARSFDEVARWLPAETQMYVPKVEATLREREGVALTDLKMPQG